MYAQWPTALLERDETQPCRRRLRKLPPDTPPPASGGLVCAVMVMEYCDKVGGRGLEEGGGGRMGRGLGRG